MAGKPKKRPEKKGNDTVVLRIKRMAGTHKVAYEQRGRSTDLGVSQFVASLFRANEELPRDQKIDDATIATILRMEYPQSKTVAKIGNGKVSIATFRWQYNHGVMTRGEIPVPKSKRYSERGYPCTPSGRELRTAYDQRTNERRKQSRLERKLAEETLEMSWDRYVSDLAEALSLYAYEFIKHNYSRRWDKCSRRRGRYKPRESTAGKSES